jgi:thiol-disulfide isomerase/thioredoxin
MKYLLTLFLSTLYFAVLADVKPVKIIAKIDNAKSDSVLIGYFPLADRELEKMDTVLLKNGVLEYQLEVKELNEMMIIPFELLHHFKNGRSYPLPGSKVRFFINNGDIIQINAKIEDKNISYTLKGNKISEQLTQSRLDKIEVFKSAYPFHVLYNEKKKAENTPDDEKTFSANVASNNRAFQNANLKYVKQHLNDEVSPLLLLEVTNRDTVAKFYQLLGTEAKKSYHGKILGPLVKGWYTTKLGQKIPPLVSKTINGKPFLLGETKEKYLLLDFWGSWCSPCIAEMPELKKFQQKYQNKVELIGLVCKDTKEKALTAIKKHALNWTHLYSETDEFGALFGLTSYPTKILLDPNGIVVKIYVGINETMMDEIATIINK